MREADKIEKMIRDKMKAREFGRDQMRGIFAVLDLLREFKKTVPEEITGADEEAINRKIAEMFMPSNIDIQHKDHIYKETKKKGGKY